MLITQLLHKYFLTENIWNTTKIFSVNPILSKVVRACDLSCFSCVRLFVTLWTVASQASPSMGFSRQVYWSRLPCLPPEDLPDPRTEPSRRRQGSDKSPTWPRLLSHQDPESGLKLGCQSPPWHAETPRKWHFLVLTLLAAECRGVSDPAHGQGEDSGLPFGWDFYNHSRTQRLIPKGKYSQENGMRPQKQVFYGKRHWKKCLEVVEGKAEKGRKQPLDHI